jgi:hypothetical protein
MDAGAVDGVPRGKIVGAVEHDVGVATSASSALPRRALLQRNDLDFRIDRGCSACLPDSALAMPTRAWVCRIWRCRLVKSTRVVIDQRDLADAGRGQVERRRRAQAAGADDQRVRMARMRSWPSMPSASSRMWRL